MTEAQITRIPKLSRNGNFRAWSVQLQAILTTHEGHKRFLFEDPDAENLDDALLDRQARAKIIMCLSHDM
jgi:hypothetical protein